MAVLMRAISDRLSSDDTADAVIIVVSFVADDIYMLYLFNSRGQYVEL